MTPTSHAARRRSTSPAIAGGLVTLGLLAAACALAWLPGSPVAAQPGGLPSGETAWGFLVLLAGAFAAYLVGLLAIHRIAPPQRAVLTIAVAVQLVPLFVPLLLSTDAWTYWAYGWIGTHGENPYVDVPASSGANPAYPYMGVAWRHTTTVYGPAFTLASEPLALLAGDSSNVAAWTYKSLASVALIAATLLAARVARRPGLAAAFVGWNPLLAVHAAGGGHNDAWVGATLMAALALASRRRHAAGALWAFAVLLKWVPLLFLALRALEARATRRAVSHTGFAVAAAAILALSTWRFGLHWLDAVVPLARHTALETKYALPARLEQLGLPHSAALALATIAFGLGLLWLAREAVTGRARLGVAACLVLVTTPYLAVWYLAWACPLAAADEDRLAIGGCLILSAYLLPQTIPL